MRRKFNDTGLCIAHRHYMVDTSAKLDQIIEMVEDGEYFTINRPRQFGKTTTLSLLTDRLNQRDDYVALRISFEEIDLDTYQQQKDFLYEVLMMLLTKLEFLHLSEAARSVEQQLERISTMPAFSRFFTAFIRDTFPGQSVVLLIDEVDKSANNQLFLNFLGMLRNKYLQRNEGQDYSFQSVILAGVHDIKTLKAKIRPDDAKHYNSPWNIAVDFTVDLSFSADEIESMLREYSRDKDISPDIRAIARQLYYYTSGYPYLVSKLCKFIDEAIVPAREENNWSVEDVDKAFGMIANEGYTTTLFDSLAKNLENNPELYELIFQIVINGETPSFSILDPSINLGHLYGIIAQADEGHCRIHNRIFEQRIYGYMMSKSLRKRAHQISGVGGPEFYTADGLDLTVVLQRFQAFMKEHYSNRDSRFLEREGRLIFLSYLRPILNGRGFEFKEPNVADERRMDLVISYRHKRYVIELKIWRGPQAHQEGLQQLSDYLDMYSLKEGYLLIYDFNKGKKYKQEQIAFRDKQIFAVWV